MARVIKQIDYNTRMVSFTGRVVFAAMGKHVTDWMRRFKDSENFKVRTLTEDEHIMTEGKVQDDNHELECVVDVLNAAQVPTEMAPGVPFTVHGRVAEALRQSAQR